MATSSFDVIDETPYSAIPARKINQTRTVLVIFSTEKRRGLMAVKHAFYWINTPF